MALSDVMKNKPTKTQFFNGQVVSAYSKQNNLVEGRVLTKDGKKVVLMNDRKWILLENCHKIKIVGDNIREAAEDDLNAAIQKVDVNKLFQANKQEQFLDLAVDATTEKYKLSSQDKEQLSTYGKTALAADNTANTPGNDSQKAEQLENDLNKFTSDNGLAVSDDKSAVTSDVSKIDESLAAYRAKKIAAIKQTLRESFGDDFDPDIEKAYREGDDVDGNDLDYTDPIEDDEEYDGEDLDDQAKLIDDKDSEIGFADDDLMQIDDKFADLENDEVGLPEDQIDNAYSAALDMYNKDEGLVAIVNTLTDDFEISVDEAEQIVEEIILDKADNFDEIIEDDIDEYEEETEIYDEEELLETLAYKYNITNMQEILSECKNVPDTILMISESLKKDFINEGTSEILASRLLRLTEDKTIIEARNDVANTIKKSIFMESYVTKIGDIPSFVEKLIEKAPELEQYKVELNEIIKQTI